MTQKNAFGTFAALIIAASLFSCKKDTEQPIEVNIDGTTLYVHPIDNSTGYAWADAYVVTGATSFTDGKQNTTLLDSLPEMYASKICSQLNAYGYSDWYLPSKNELVGIFLNMEDKSSFSEGFYWSSTETWETNAWGVDALSGNTDILLKNLQRPCRCVRKD